MTGPMLCCNTDVTHKVGLTGMQYDVTRYIAVRNTAQYAALRPRQAQYYVATRTSWHDVSGRIPVVCKSLPATHKTRYPSRGQNIPAPLFGLCQPVAVLPRFGFSIEPGFPVRATCKANPPPLPDHRPRTEQRGPHGNVVISGYGSVWHPPFQIQDHPYPDDQISAGHEGYVA